MKTTFDLPDQLMREAKASAALRGAPLKQFMEEAVAEKLARDRRTRSPEATGLQWPVPPPEGIDPEDAALIDAAIEEAFEQIEAEDEHWA